MSFNENSFPVAPPEYVNFGSAPVASIAEQLSAIVESNNNGACSMLNNSQFQYVSVNKVAIGGSKGDVQVKLPRPTTFIAVANVPIIHNTDALFFHMAPIGFTYTGNTITPTGNEPWICLCNSQYTNVTGMVGKWIEFCQPIDTFYLDIGHEGGGGDYVITFLCDDRAKGLYTRI